MVTVFSASLVGFISCAAVVAGVIYLMYANGDRHVVAIAARVADLAAQLREGRDRRGKASDTYRDALEALIAAGRAEDGDLKAFNAALEAADNALEEGDAIAGGGR